MKRKNDPFAGIKITPRFGKQTITYNYGASYINAWRDCLAQSYPAERLADSAYVVSQDDVGQKPSHPVS